MAFLFPPLSSSPVEAGRNPGADAFTFSRWFGLTARVGALGGWLLLAATSGWAAPELRPVREQVLSRENLVLSSGGVQRRYEFALAEVALRGRDGRTTLQGVPAQADAEALRRWLKAQPAAANQSRALVLYEAGRPRSAATRLIATREVVIGLADGVSAGDLAARLGIDYVGPLDYAPGYHRFQAADSAEALLVPESLQQHSGVQQVLPQLARLRVRTAVPDDPHYSAAWHLRNTGQNSGTPGIDLNVESVWDNYRGTGVVIGIVDDSLQLTHPDLAPNINVALSRDYREGDNDPSPNLVTPNQQDPMNDPREDEHGTMVAGVAAGRGFNGLGVTGVAPAATLAGIRLIGDYITDLQEADAIAHRNDAIAVKNNSWGPRDDGATLSGPRELAASALRAGVRNGRGGRGTIFLWAAGNGGEDDDNSNKNGYANAIEAIAVGAIDDHGVRAAYSEIGANILVCAPAGGSRGPGTATTDLLGDDGMNYTGSSDPLGDPAYTSRFLGTSSSTPMVAGVVALMLEARPTLGWRDVQEILVRTARRNDTDDSGWIVNAAGFHFNDQYGAGLVDAAAAVNLAKTWTNLGPMRTLARSLGDSTPPTIPDGGELVRVFDFAGASLRVEHVQVKVFMDHAVRGQLEVSLTSPGGTVSRLARAHADDDEGGYYDWTFSSVQHWGESAAGNWTVRVKDTVTGETGRLFQCTVTLLGTETGGAQLPAAPTSLTAQATSTHEIRLTWSDDASNETGYVVEYAYGWGGMWTVEAAALPANTTTYTQRYIPQGAEFYYRVKAVNATGSSGYSPEAHKRTLDGPGAPVFSTAFETGEGFFAGAAIGGTAGWIASPSSLPVAGNTVVSNGFSSLGVSGRGQQARLSAGGATGSGYYELFQPAYATSRPGSVLRMSMKLATLRSTNSRFDSFTVNIYNAAGYFVASLLFDEYYQVVYQASSALQNYVYTGVSYQASRVYALEITLNYESNTWSAKLDNTQLVSSQPLFATAGTLTRDFGGFSLSLLPATVSIPGNNALLVDDILIEQVQTAALAAPSALTARPYGTSLIYLTWQDDLFASRYEVERSPDGISGWTKVATVEEDQEYYLDTGLTTATKYYYRLRSANDVWGASAYTSVQSATTFTEYEDWKDYHRLELDAPGTADPDGDGVPLLLEYALGLSPKHPSAESLPDTRVAEGRVELIYYRARSDVTYVVEASTDLKQWSADGVTQQQSLTGLWVTASAPLPSSGARFLRLRVEIP